MDNNDFIIKFLNNFLATVARQRIERMIRGKKITIEPYRLQSENEIFGEYLSIIMLSSSAGAMYLKIHFNLDVAKVLAAGALEKNINEISQESALDFMKECSNGVCGFVRSLYESHQIIMGMSLPFITEGIDEVFFRKNRDSKIVANNWLLRLNSGESVIFSSEICFVKTQAIFDRMEKFEEALIESENDTSSDGDVEFLF